MKTLKHLFVAVLTTAFFTVHSPAKAGTHDDGSLNSGARDKWQDWHKDDGKKGGGSGSGNSGPGSANLPVNDYAWALAIFGAAIGAKFITDKVKFAKTKSDIS